MATRRALTILLTLLLCASAAQAHVPFLEDRDFTCDKPFVPEMPEQSLAVYAWLEGKHDVDYYVFEIKTKTPFLAEVLVPVHPQYAKFRPAFALIGKGFPKAPKSLPVRPHEGYGALVFLDLAVGPRKSFYEPFGGKSYYRGPRVERVLEPGRYAVIYWDPRHGKGDYVAVLGRKEIWRPKDIGRALRITPRIRRGKELHLDKTKPATPPAKPAQKPRGPRSTESSKDG